MMTKVSPLVWSPYQNAIFDDVVNGKNHTVVIARAGSSKTTVLVEAIKRIPNKRSKVLAVAFSKKIAIELDERINKSYIDISTLHSFGLRTIRSCFGKVEVVPDKVQTILYKLFPTGLSAGDAFLLEKTVGLCKASITDAPSKIDELMDNFDIVPLDLERDVFAKTVVKILGVCKEQKTIVDFNDMIWFNIVNGLPCKQYDYVLIDELQDLSKAQIHMALSACKKTGRIFAFGDDMQAIFGWAGVDMNGVFNVRDRLNAKVLPLPISYRCPKVVIELAKQYVPDIEAAPNAKEGNVFHIKEDRLMDYVKVGDFVLSRTNAPLVKHCMMFLRNKIPSEIQGKDIDKGLLFLIKKSKKTNLKEFIEWLDVWKNSEVNRLLEKKRSPAFVYDKYECLLNLCEDAKTVSDVEDNIKEMFRDDDDNSKVVFSTVHACKGLERSNVFVLEGSFRYSEEQEERNVRYVCLTRSKDTICFVDK
jgi:DNA helicase II / ATP-dependent DNA helicase PcrA